MDNSAVERLRKAIRYKFMGSPHRARTWLAVLEMHVEREKRREAAQRMAVTGTTRGNPAVKVRSSPSTWSLAPKRGAR